MTPGRIVDIALRVIAVVATLWLGVEVLAHIDRFFTQP